MRKIAIAVAGQLMLLAAIFSPASHTATATQVHLDEQKCVSQTHTHARLHRFRGESFGYAAPPAYAMPSADNYRESNLGALSAPAAATTVPRLGTADYLTYVTAEGTYNWPKERLPLKIYIAPGQGVSGYRPAFRNIVTSAFDAWVSATDGKLAWLEVSDRTSANITIEFTNRVTERAEGTEAGHTSCLTRLNTVTRRGVIMGAKMQLLSQLPDRAFSDDEMRKTALHEAGHAFGIQGHSPNRDDIMYFAVSPTQKPLLTVRDAATMQRLYVEYPGRSPDEIALLRGR